MSAAVLSVRGLSKVYPGVQALSGVDLDIFPGAVNVLIGENGAGKSTLMKVIAGAERPSSGQILIDGEPVQFSGTAQAGRHGVAIVFQELNLFGNLSVAENIFIGRELVRGVRGIDGRAQERRAAEILARLHHQIDPRGLVEDLTVGQQQIVEIARALAQDARVLILDEPTSALSAAETETLFSVIAALKARGVAIVYISHRLEELIRIGDFVTVLRDGQVTGHERMADVDLPWIVRHMLGREQKDFAKAVAHARGPVVLEVADVSLPTETGRFTVDHVSLSVRAGEIVGVYGLLGAGRTELLECIMGLRPDCTGDVLIDGRSMARADLARRIRCGLFLAPEDRRRDGLVEALSVAQNLVLASLGRMAKGGYLAPKVEAEAVERMRRDLGIKVSDPRLPIGVLSGGNQQKVVIGKALLTQPRVLLMDEPTRGVDVGAKSDLYAVMRKLAADGLGVLFATSELEEAMALSDRIAVMREGRMAAVFDRADATENLIVAAAMPIAAAYDAAAA